MSTLMDLVRTPEGMVIAAGIGFILIVLVLTALIFWIGSLFRRSRRGLDAERDDEELSERDASDPLESFDRSAARSRRAPIGLARLRAAGPDITAASEPTVTPVPASASPEPAPMPPAQPLQAPQEPQMPQVPQPQQPQPAQRPPAPPEPPPPAQIFQAPAPQPVQTLQPVQPLQPAQPAQPAEPGLLHPGAPQSAVLQPQPVSAVVEPPFAQPQPRLRPRAADPFAGAGFLLTLPFERRGGLSLAHADLCGMGVEAVFFDPDAVCALDEDALRLVPFLPAGSARLLLTESDRRTFRAGPLCAQPDAVLELADGLIALEYKTRGGRPEDPLRWAESIRSKDLLQTVLGALTLSASAGRPAAPVLRTVNAVFFLRPQPDLRRWIAAHAAEAEAFMSSAAEGASRPGISASDYAQLLEPALAKLYPRAVSAASAAGEAAHDELLRRRTPA